MFNSFISWSQPQSSMGHWITPINFLFGNLYKLSSNFQLSSHFLDSFHLSTLTPNMTTDINNLTTASDELANAHKDLEELQLQLVNMRTKLATAHNYLAKAHLLNAQLARLNTRNSLCILCSFSSSFSWKNRLLPSASSHPRCTDMSKLPTTKTACCKWTCWTMMNTGAWYEVQ